jgi:hypothetical protein
MIIDFVDEVVEAKNLDCPHFKIDFRRAAKTVPAVESEVPTTHYIEFEDVQRVLRKTDAFIARVCNRVVSEPRQRTNPSVQFHPGIGFDSIQQPAVSDTDTVASPLQPINRPMGAWVPPPSASDTRSEYHNHCKFHMRPDQAAWNSAILGAALVCCPLQYLHDNTSWRG